MPIARTAQPVRLVGLLIIGTPAGIPIAQRAQSLFSTRSIYRPSEAYAGARPTSAASAELGGQPRGSNELKPVCRMAENGLYQGRLEPLTLAMSRVAGSWKPRRETA